MFYESLLKIFKSEAMFNTTLFFIVTLVITFGLFVVLMCVAILIPFRREFFDTSRRVANHSHRPKQVATDDNPPKYEDAIKNPPDYSIRETNK